KVGLQYLYDVYPTPGVAVKYTNNTPYNTVKGLCFIDYNNNSIQDGGEPGYNQATIVSVSSKETRTTLSNSIGNFRNYLFDTGNVVTSVKNVKYFSITPLQHVSNFPSLHGTDSVIFSFVRIPGIQDLQVSIMPLDPLRVNNLADYLLQYTNVGT